MKHTRSAAALLALAASAGFAIGQIVDPQVGDELVPRFVDDAVQVDERPAVSIFIDNPQLQPINAIPAEYTYSRSISLDTAAFKKLTVGRQVSITTEPNVTDTWYVESISEPSNNIRYVRCKHTTDGSAYLAFCTYEDATAMTMSVPSRKATYRLQFAGNDQYFIWKLNPANTPNEEHSHPAVPDIFPRDLDPTDDDYVPADNPYAPRDAGACGGTSRVLDIMIVYTTDARDAIGGTTAMRAECALAVDHANTAYQGSAMSTRMRLVYCNVITYTESGDQDIDLPRLRDTNDGFMDSVHTTRDSVNADMVALVNDTGSGLGYCPGGTPTYAGSPFNTCRWTRVAATYTLAHETGHNLGGGHDVANDGACGPSYGVGHLFGPANDGWCTVIAYPTSTHPRVLRYSNPNVNFNGYATGVAIGSPGEAFNARVLIDNDNTVEGFELTRYDIYVDFAFGGFPAEIGTASFPYNTFAEGVTNIDVPNTGAGENPTMYIDAGSQNYIGTVSKAMNIIPCGGTVTIGTP